MRIENIETTYNIDDRVVVKRTYLKDCCVITGKELEMNRNSSWSVKHPGDSETYYATVIGICIDRDHKIRYKLDVDGKYVVKTGSKNGVTWSIVRKTELKHFDVFVEV